MTPRCPYCEHAMHLSPITGDYICMPCARARIAAMYGSPPARWPPYLEGTAKWGLGGAAYATGQGDVPDAWRRRLSLMLASEMLSSQTEAVRRQRPS